MDTGLKKLDTVYCTNFHLKQDVDLDLKGKEKPMRRARTYTNRIDMHLDLQELTGDIIITN